jgi:GNAT superfamily N-acetyltransferase
VNVVVRGLRLEFDRIDSEAGAALVRAVLAEYVVRYGGTDADTPAPDEFTAAEGGAFVIAYVDTTAVGCGGLRRLAPQAERAPADRGTPDPQRVTHHVGEIKRMYVHPEARGKGVGRAILRALEDRARDLGYTTLRLETGVRQPEAISLYESADYLAIEPYGYYRASPLNRCFEKHLPPTARC